MTGVRLPTAPAGIVNALAVRADETTGIVTTTATATGKGAAGRRIGKEGGPHHPFAGGTIETTTAPGLRRFPAMTRRISTKEI
jgi:hypothetical protein